jgi:hypothetical protein
LYEHRSRPLISTSAYLGRLAQNVFFGVLVLFFALALGVFGYHRFEGMTWLDAFANAAMILSGMGPLTPLHTDGGKVFAGCYALFSGLVFIAVAGIVLAPAVHRLLHRFHLEREGSGR